MNLEAYSWPLNSYHWRWPRLDAPVWFQVVPPGVPPEPYFAFAGNQIPAKGVEALIITASALK